MINIDRKFLMKIYETVNQTRYPLANMCRSEDPDELWTDEFDQELIDILEEIRKILYAAMPKIYNLRINPIRRELMIVSKNTPKFDEEWIELEIETDNIEEYIKSNYLEYKIVASIK